MMPDFFRNRVTEKDIRDWFDQNGYRGGSAVFDSVELHAIQRPGWRQLFRFHGSVCKSESDDGSYPRIKVWGVVIDDERKQTGQTEVFLFTSEASQQAQLTVLSADMLTATHGQGRELGVWSMLLVGLAFAAVFTVIVLLKKYL